MFYWLLMKRYLVENGPISYVFAAIVIRACANLFTVVSPVDGSASSQNYITGLAWDQQGHFVKTR